MVIKSIKLHKVDSHQFVYNRRTHSTTSSSPFQIIYGFSSLTLLDLLLLPCDARAEPNGRATSNMVHELHEKTKGMIDKKNTKVALRRNKGCRIVIFQSGDLVWVHPYKERFLSRIS